MTEAQLNRDGEKGSVEPWGPRLWLALAAVLVVAVAIQSYGMTSWPMADDEVPSLVELGLADIGAGAFSVPRAQVGRLPRALPVWYGFQRFAIDLLPASETSYRLPTLVFGVLTSVFVFLLSARWRSLWFAVALTMIMLGSQPFVYVVQLNRFYSMPLLLLVLTMTVMWLPGHPVLMLVATATLTVLTVLSHNITIAFFGLAFLAALAAFVVGRAPWPLVLRSGVALAVSGIVYVAYLRPIISGWSSTGNPTPILVSYAAYLGVPTLALALFGASLVLLGRESARAMTWWLLIFAGSFCVFFVAQFNFNPRYFLFFFTAAWVLAAHAMTHVAGRLGRGLAGGAWYACVAVLLLPGLMSHFQDGSRHDYRRAAAVVVGQALPGEHVLSDDAETISYYLPEDLRQRLFVRTKVRPSDLPASSFLLVARSNAWMPQPQYADRRLELLAEIYTRRFDQFSHILRVYRVAAAESP